MGILADAAKQQNAEVFGTGSSMFAGLATQAAGSFFGGLGSSLGGGKAAAPQNAESRANVNANQDNSGWTVATGGSSASGAGKLPWYVWVIVGVVAFKYVQKVSK